MGALWVLEGRAVVEFTCCETEDGVRRRIRKLGYFGIFLGFLVARFRAVTYIYCCIRYCWLHIVTWPLNSRDLRQRSRKRDAWQRCILKLS